MNKVGGTLIALGLVLALGTAGASDLETIEFAQLAGQALLASAICTVGYVLIYIGDKRTDR